MLAYFDLYSGASGDMILSALLDAGVELDALREDLGQLGVQGYEITAEQVRRGEMRATSVRVRTEEHAASRHLRDILAVIDGSSLAPAVKENARRVFISLAEAEARVHGTGIDDVHFHEVGAVDALVDVVGVCLALHMLNITQVQATPFPLTHGSVQTEHGWLPVPAPATLELIARANAPIVPPPPGAQGELVTPTGAALLCTLASFGPASMQVRRVGYGAGQKEMAHPNVLRVLLGEGESADSAETIEPITLLETNIDDMSPQVHGYLIDRLLHAGGLDVYTTPVGMKKSRPGTMLSVLCRPDDALRLGGVLLRETTTLGVRLQTLHRLRADRSIDMIQTPLGAVRVKIKRVEGAVVTATPEYEDCAELAQRHGRPLIEVMAMAADAARGYSGEAL